MIPNLSPGAGFVFGRGEVCTRCWKTAKKAALGLWGQLSTTAQAGMSWGASRGRIARRFLSGPEAAVERSRGDRG